MRRVFLPTYRFSASVPIVDTTNFMLGKPEAKSDCQAIADALHKFGCVVIKDPRVNQQHNDRFLDMIERYFEGRGRRFYQGQKIEEIFPEKYYQIGATPEFIEKARLHEQMTSHYSDANKAMTPQPPPYDAKWRYFWQVSESGKTDFINENVVPQDFPDWQQNMDNWGSMMIKGCVTVSEMAAEGMDLPRDAFSRLLVGGHHLLAPTASDLIKYNQKGSVFAGFHYDLNFLTIHGKSRYPGLFVWLRSGEKVSVSVPDGHLLLQAGKQFEILTGGHVTCGFHEVVYTDAVRQKVEEAQNNGKCTWRISSTLFSHINYDVTLRPLYKFDTPESSKLYPPVNAYDQVQEELKAISLRIE